MTERLLHFIWQFQYYNKSELATVTEEPLQVIQVGQYNTNQGPDFGNARIQIGNTTWIGNIELHLKTSDWEKHLHQHDSNYNNVILHVVWEHDHQVHNEVPVLELKSRVSKILLERYEMLMRSGEFIPCEKNINTIPATRWMSWKERLLAERLLRKSALVVNYLEQNSFHWEETFWWLLARNFGTKVNADAFEEIARSLPLQILAKHKMQVQVLEALLMGQGGLLEDLFKDDYAKMLQKEYRFYQRKYQLRPVHTRLQFLRMRPGNFPTLRLAQLAMLIHESAHLFAKIKDEPGLKNVRKWMGVTASDYWHYRYRFDEDSGFREKHLGQDMIDNIIINAIVPMFFAYGEYHHDEKYKQKALDWLEETGSENNAVIRSFGTLGIIAENAFDSQALLELKTQYCDARKCLECSVGNWLLRDQSIQVNSQ